MKPTIVFGDIHGLTVWKEIAEQNPDCRYIFLGDYLDPLEKTDRDTLINNMKEIIRFKKNNFDSVALLLGNHDLHYFTDDICPSAGFDFDVLEIASILFAENFNCFQYAYQIGKYVFTHAGISQKWFLYDFKGTLNQNIAKQLNNPTDAQIKALCRVSEHFGGKKGESGGIFFAHRQDLYEPLHGFTQIVGHHRTDEISEYKSEYGNIIFCDALWNEQYLKIVDSELFVEKYNIKI
jgi:hypothetical protein